VEWSCSQLLQNTPLHPIAEWGRQRFGSGDVPPEQRLADLESSLAQVKLDPAESAALLAPLLDIPLPQERTSTLTPEELRRRQLAALTNRLMAGARAQSIVLAIEDAQWADPTTLDLLRGIAERGALVPTFLLGWVMIQDRDASQSKRGSAQAEDAQGTWSAHQAAIVALRAMGAIKRFARCFARLMRESRRRKRG
jgi:predicted ATPase